MRTADLFESPDKYPSSFSENPDTGKIAFAEFTEMNRQRYSDIIFHDARDSSFSRTEPLGLQKLYEIFSAQSPPLRPVRYIFHSAFCCSTLLSRCLDVTSATIPLREPWVLTQLAWQKRMMSHDNPAAENYWQTMLVMMVALLSRSYHPTQISVIKVHNGCNNLMTELMATGPNARGLFLYSDLKTFLMSSLKPERSDWLQNQLMAFSRDVSGLARIRSVDVNNLSKPEVAAYIWLTSVQSYIDFSGSGAGGRVTSLNCDLLLRSPAETLNAVVDHFLLAISAENIADVVNGSVFKQYAKTPGITYSTDDRKEMYRKIEQQYSSEIQQGLDWFDEITRDDPVPEILPNKLSV